MIGTKLAHYEITGHLGSGGMGEVYQATDIRSLDDRLPSAGGLPQVLTNVNVGRGGSWNVEGTILFGLANGVLYRIPLLREKPQL